MSNHCFHASQSILSLAPRGRSEELRSYIIGRLSEMFRVPEDQFLRINQHLRLTQTGTFSGLLTKNR